MRKKVIKIRYAQIRSLDVSNGEGVGIALFVQGCHFKCENCFNPETWDFNGGKEWTEEIENQFIELANRPYITRISILGGEALAEENLDDVLALLKQLRILFGNSKTVWLYSGFTWDDIWCESNIVIDDITAKVYEDYIQRREILKLCDVFIDGRFEKDKADMSYPYAGSTNQRVIDVQRSLSENQIILNGGQ